MNDVIQSGNFFLYNSVGEYRSISKMLVYRGGGGEGFYRRWTCDLILLYTL